MYRQCPQSALQNIEHDLMSSLFIPSVLFTPKEKLNTSSSASSCLYLSYIILKANYYSEI